MAPEKNTVEEKTAYVYLLLCDDGTYYCGYTVDMEWWLVVHRAGKSVKHTRGRGLPTLVYLECLPNKRAVLCREAAPKRLPRSGKEALLQSPGNPAEGENGNRL